MHFTNSCKHSLSHEFSVRIHLTTVSYHFLEYINARAEDNDICSDDRFLIRLYIKSGAYFENWYLMNCHFGHSSKQHENIMKIWKGFQN